jgi:hypothetical protein
LESLLRAEVAFAPDDVAVLTSAFEDALRRLGLVDRADPATTLVARAIIEAAKTGEKDPIRLRDLALLAIAK